MIKERAQSHQKISAIGQVMVEAVLSLIGSLVLLYGIIVIWGWLNKSMVGAQVGYQQTRVQAGSSAIGKLNTFEQPKLSLFGEVSGTIGSSAGGPGARPPTRRTDPRAGD